MQTVTSWTLLDGLKDPENQTLWADYVDRYRPLLVQYFVRLGIQAPDAEDVAQDALLAFAKAYREGSYDPAKGRLRRWFFGIAHVTLRSWNRSRERHRAKAVSAASEIFAAIPDEDRLQEIWEEEWRHAVLRACMHEVQRDVEPKTFEAFELFAQKGLPARDVAERLTMSENAVFGAKRRVLDRIKKLLPEMEEIW